MDAGLRIVRTTEERLTDALVTLAAYARIQQTSGEGVGDRLKATKLLFLINHLLFVARVRALHLSFHRSTYGPSTADIYDTWQELTSADYLSVDPHPRGEMVVTPEGLACAERFTREVLEMRRRSPAGEMAESRAGSAVLRVINQVAADKASSRTGELLDAVYAMRLRPVGWNDQVRIGDVPEGVYLTKIVEEREATAVLRVPGRWHRGLRLAQMRAVADTVGPDRPVLDGLTLAEAQDLDEALAQEERGAARSVDVAEEVARLQAALGRSAPGG